MILTNHIAYTFAKPNSSLDNFVWSYFSFDKRMLHPVTIHKLFFVGEAVVLTNHGKLVLTNHGKSNLL